jgi:hypothetical protein
MYPVPHCMYLFGRGNRPLLAGVPGMAQVACNAISLSVDSAWWRGVVAQSVYRGSRF